VDDLDAVARRHGMVLRERVQMPASNLLLVFQPVDEGNSGG
jgi:hypothetical protein